MPDVYVHLADGAVDRTREVADGVCVDHASSGEVIGVEVLGARSVDIDGKPVVTRAQIEAAARRIGVFSGREFQRHLDVPLAYQMFTDAGFSVEGGEQS